MTPREIYKKFLEFDCHDACMAEYNNAQDALLEFVLAQEREDQRIGEIYDEEYISQHRLTGKDLGL